VDEDTNATVDTVGEDVDGGELEGVRVEGGEGGGLPNRTAAGVREFILLFAMMGGGVEMLLN